MLDSSRFAELNRRATLRGLGLLAAGALGSRLFEACAPPAPAAPQATSAPSQPLAPPPTSAPTQAPTAALAPTAAAKSSAVRPPAFVAVQGGPTPDLPGSGNGLDPGFFRFPSTLFKAVAEQPGNGETFTSLTIVTGLPPAPLDSNTAWQAVNQAMHVTANLGLVSSADYAAKVPTVVAGADLPDFMYGLNQYLPNLPVFLQQACQDLTAHLSGDAIKEYPHLANIPTPCWKTTVFNNGIYALPIPRPPAALVFLYRKDLVDQAGLELPNNADEFKRLLVSLTNPQQSRWGITTSTGSFGLQTGGAMLQLFRVPNNWRLDPGGKLVKDFETEEFKAAIDYVRDLWASGVWHPNSLTFSAVASDDALRGSSQAVVEPTTWGNYAVSWPVLLNLHPEGRLDVMHPFAFDGGKPVAHFGPATFGLNFMKKQTPDRVKLLLRVANFLAAPFGSQEWALINYGVQGVHHTPDANGNPVLTDAGKAQVGVPWRYIVDKAPVLFDPNHPDEFARMGNAAEQAILAAGIGDPTLGQYSVTNSTKGVVIQNAMYAGITDLVVGRRPMSDLDQLVSDWRAGGGDQIRAEFQQALTTQS